MKNQKELEARLRVILWSAAIFSAVTFGTYLWWFWGSLSTSQSDWGTFGDYVGGTLSAVLGFLSLIALLLTITIQSRQLDISKTELSNSSAALKLSAIAQQETADALKKQTEYAEISAKLSALQHTLGIYTELLGQYPMAFTTSQQIESHESLVASKEKVAGEIMKLTDKLLKT